MRRRGRSLKGTSNPTKIAGSSAIHGGASALEPCGMSRAITAMAIAAIAIQNQTRLLENALIQVTRVYQYPQILD